MGTRELVKNSSFSSHDCCNCGSCPHCGRSIHDYASVEKCQYCGEPIAWRWEQLSTCEKATINDEAKRQEKEHNKRIKPCPFCGNSVSFPSIRISKSENPHLFLSVGCFACGIELTEFPFKAEMESLERANKALIKKWNTRWKDEPD